jgi:LPS-assembly lipoprotein
MSSSRRFGRISAGGALVCGALALGGCLQPMYGNLAAGGPGVDSELQAIAIEPVSDRIGHYVGDDLIFALNGTGSHPTPKYRLFVTVNEDQQTPLIDTVTGIATAATLTLHAEYRLVRIDNGAVLTKGTSLVMKTYDRTSERFSNIRAARDAEQRDAQQLADDLRLRLSAYFADHRGA